MSLESNSSQNSEPKLQLENPKLLTMTQVLAWRKELKAQGKKLVLTNGVYDLLHAGHLYSLREARAQGDVLLVAITSDAGVKKLNKGPNRPIQGETERAYALAACSFVDKVFIFPKTMVGEIEAIKPDVYCKAGDYTIETINQQERVVLERNKVDVRFMPFLKGFSTTNLIKKIIAAGGI